MSDLGITFAVISMLGFGLSSALSKPLITKYGVKQSLFLRNLVITIILLFLTVFFASEVKLEPYYVLIAAVIAVIGYFPILWLYKGLKTGKLGVVTPIANSSILVTVLLAVYFFQEKINSIQTIGIALIPLGILLLSINFKEWQSSDFLNKNSGIHYALLTFLGWGVVFFLLKIPTVEIGALLTSLILESGILLCTTIDLLINKEKLPVIDVNKLKEFGVIALLTTSGTLFFNLGVKIASTSIVASISAAKPVISAGYGKIFNKEKLTKQQYLAIAVILIGTILLVSS